MPRAAALFKLESDLVPILSRHLKSQLLGPKLARRSLALPHFQIGMTIPDLLIIAARGEQATKPARRVRLTAFDAWVVTALKRAGPLRHDEIVQELHSQPERVQFAIRRLQRHRLVKRTDDSTYVLNSRRFSLTAEIVAVEAKLARWADGIGQALSYLSFANRAYVALPQRTVLNSRKVREACRDSGIGLISVGASRTQVLVRPMRREPLSPERVWLIWKTLGLRD